MAYRYGNRNQINLFPASIEEYVAEDDPVRAYDAFVEALDFNELGIILDANKVGNSEYDPKAMLKLLVYGYSYGIRSSRKLERAVHHNVSFIWLTGGLKPDHKTIAEFRRKNKKQIQLVLKQCARLCIELNMIEGNTLFIDGSKMRANASLNNRWTQEKCERHLKRIDERIEEILRECEDTDAKEQHSESLVKLQDELVDKNKLKSKIEKVLHKLKKENLKSLNSTDPDSIRVKSRKGSYAGYSAEIAVDEKHGLIVNGDVVSENNDLQQFSNQINKANEVLEKKCKVACADSGFANIEEQIKINEQGIKIVVPSRRQALKKDADPFNKIYFKYVKEKDCYICPAGQELIPKHFLKKAKKYRTRERRICRECKYFSQCTKSNKGRAVERRHDEETKERFEKQYNEPDSQEIYKLRKQKVELPFGHMKRNLKFDSFLLRKRNGVKAEMAILGTCFNIARMISLSGGVTALIDKLN
jgi:transposase